MGESSLVVFAAIAAGVGILVASGVLDLSQLTRWWRGGRPPRWWLPFRGRGIKKPGTLLWSQSRAMNGVTDLRNYHLNPTLVALGRYNRSVVNSVEVIARLSGLAAGQWGLLTAAQAERGDVTRSQLARLADAGILERLERGVYANTSSTDENRTLRAAWLALDPARTAEERLADPVRSGVISHTSAASLHNLGDLLDDEPEITYSHRKQTRRGIRVHRGDLTDGDVTLVGGLPTTTVERTLADLLRDGHDQEHLAQMVGQGVRRGVIDLPNLAQRLEPLARRYGHPNGRSLVTHLLDLAGLSAAALARDLSKTSAGQELMAAGRTRLLHEILTSMPELKDSISADFSKYDTSHIAGLLSVAMGTQPPTSETEVAP
jgi:Transcriptional regulator, AbiEi antitoxin